MEQDLRAALLVALEDFWHLVDVLAGHESALESKSSYYGLFAHCFQLHRSLIEYRGPEDSPPSISIADLLDYLESLIRPQPEFPPCKATTWITTTYPGLTGFHEFMSSDELNELDKVKLMRQCVDLETKEQFEAFQDMLVTANRRLNDQGLIQSDDHIQQKPRQRPPDHILPAADSLFKVLDSKKSCACNPGHQYVVQLCLETHLARIDECNFDLYLGLERSWQEARIQSVPANPSSGAPRIVLGTSNGTPLAGLGAARKRELKRKVERLCADIIKIRQTLPDYRLKFRMEEDCLWKLQSERSSVSIDPTKAPVTLEQFIAEKSNLLNEKTKRVLSVLLSYATYHLIGTPWLKSWGSSNITFFRSSTGLPLRPYIETRLDESVIENIPLPPLDTEVDDFDPDDALRPPYPCLVDLAVVLLELHKAASFDSLAEQYSDYCAVGSDVLMDRYLITREIFKHCAAEMTDQTRMAVKACLNPAIGLDEDGLRLDESSLRGAIYQQVIHPLEDELEQGFSDLAVDQLDALVRNLDLANGGQLLPLEEKVNYLEQPFNIHRRKRGCLDDTERPRVRVRFSHQLETHVEDGATLQPAANNNTCSSGVRLNNHSNNVRKTGLVLSVKDRPPSKKPDTIRVLNIPDGMSKQDLKTEIDNVFGSPSKVYSLARASRAGTCWRKHATVTFPSLPNEQLVQLLVTTKKDMHTRVALQYDKLFMGVTPLYDAGENSVVDIIALEGLGTNAFGTFRSPQDDAMWLRDFLPDAFPACRILLYGYDSRVPGSKSSQSVPEIAGTCKNFIMNFRELTETTKRPIIWIGQSMGGLIVQEVLIQSHQYSSTDPGDLMAHTIGFLGYGVPTNGLRNESLLNLVREQPNFGMIKSICIEDDKPSRYLVDLSNRFALCSKSICDRVYHFYETNPSPDIIDTDALPIRRVHDPEVVGRENRYWVPANHSELVKITSPSDLTYIATVQALSIIQNSISR